MMRGGNFLYANLSILFYFVMLFVHQKWFLLLFGPKVVL